MGNKHTYTRVRPLSPSDLPPPLATTGNWCSVQASTETPTHSVAITEKREELRQRKERHQLKDEEMPGEQEKEKERLHFLCSACGRFRSEQGDEWMEVEEYYRLILRQTGRLRVTQVSHVTCGPCACLRRNASHTSSGTNSTHSGPATSLATPRAAAKGSLPRHHSVIVVDDDNLSRRVVQRQVRKAGLGEAVLCTSAAEAIEAVQAVQRQMALQTEGPTTTSDGSNLAPTSSTSTTSSSILVLTDVNMPQMGGIELCRILRAQGGPYWNPPLPLPAAMGTRNQLQSRRRAFASSSSFSSQHRVPTTTTRSSTGTVVVPPPPFPSTFGGGATDREPSVSVPTTLRIIGMSGFAEYEDPCIEAGMDAFITKPVTADALIRALAEISARV